MLTAVSWEDALEGDRLLVLVLARMAWSGPGCSRASSVGLEGTLVRVLPVSVLPAGEWVIVVVVDIDVVVAILAHPCALSLSRPCPRARNHDESPSIGPSCGVRVMIDTLGPGPSGSYLSPRQQDLYLHASFTLRRKRVGCWGGGCWGVGATKSLGETRQKRASFGPNKNTLWPFRSPDQANAVKQGAAISLELRLAAVGTSLMEGLSWCRARLRMAWWCRRNQDPAVSTLPSTPLTPSPLARTRSTRGQDAIHAIVDHLCRS